MLTLIYFTLYAQTKTWMSRCSNKTLFSVCLRPLWQWVREGARRVRLALLLNLDHVELDELTDDDEDPEEKDTTKLLSEMAFEVVNALVIYSGGKGPSGSNEYGFFPYGKEASWSTSAFKKVPTAWFALTFAEMYPFLFRDTSKWDELRKKRAYPMTNLWPHSYLKRYIKFHRAFNKQRTFLFKSYEKEGGVYHGNESECEAKSRSQNTVADSEASSAETSDDPLDLYLMSSV